MRVIIETDAETACISAARIICDQIHKKPNSVLGLATGGTPTRCYQELIRRFQNGEIDFSQTRSFNLDEYIGLPEEHPESYHAFMKAQLFDHVNIPAGNWHVPKGLTDDLTRECERYEAAITAEGGIDIQLLGLGRDGHIGFNEPGSSLASRTRVKHLTMQTIADNARFFGSEELVPRLAITMGVGTILDAGHCLMLATGAGKAEAVAAMIEGPVSASVPATALQFHRNVTVLLDQDAAKLLKHGDYYRMSENAQRIIDNSMGV